MHNYCTLFDMKYFPKWYVMYRSWQKFGDPEDMMYVLPMDDETYNFMTSRGWPQVKVLDPGYFLREELRAGKTHAEFCWMMAPILCDRLLNDTASPFVRLKEVTYLDADICFFAPISLMWSRIGKKPVGIIPHRFPQDEFARLSPNGLYNVSWVTFQDDAVAKWLSNRWAQQVIKKCDRQSCGDQKYLDEWPGLLGNQLHVFEEHGIGMGPWNAKRYSISQNGFIESADDNRCPFSTTELNTVLFYHFHELRRNNDGSYFMTGYQLPSSVIMNIYRPYLKELDAAYNLMEAMRGNK